MSVEMHTKSAWARSLRDALASVARASGTDVALDDAAALVEIVGLQDKHYILSLACFELHATIQIPVQLSVPRSDISAVFELFARQRDVCERMGSAYLAPKFDAMVVVPSDYQTLTTLWGLRVSADTVLSGWWFHKPHDLQPQFSHPNSIPVHMRHVVEKFPDVAAFVALEVGYRIMPDLMAASYDASLTTQ
jgi:hypothetical protein